MKKRYTHKKNKTSRSRISFMFIHYSLSILGVCILVALLYPAITNKMVPCANSISCKTIPKFETEKNAIGTYNNQPIYAPNIVISQNEHTSPVLGINTSTRKKHIFVDLVTQTLSAYEDDDLFMKTPISSGLWGKTPKGDFTIWVKYRATRMSGGNGDDYYDLPNVPYVMFFSNSEVPGSAGFSIHGTYWHNNFGHAMSHGCINMKNTDVAKLFDWADAPSNGNKGTQITIYGDQPV